MDSRTALVTLARFAQGQWGMVTSAQAVQAGVSYMQLKRMTEAGLLEKAGQGVYLMIGGQAAAAPRGQGGLAADGPGGAGLGAAAARPQQRDRIPPFGGDAAATRRPRGAGHGVHHPAAADQPGPPGEAARGHARAVRGDLGGR